MPVSDQTNTSVVTTSAMSGIRRNTFVYDCGVAGESLSVIARLGPGEIAVWPPSEWGGGYFVLGQVRAASGSRYEGDGLVVWVQGDEAMIEVAGERHSGCQLNPHSSIWEHARLSGVVFRGIGNEPGWSIEVRDHRIDLEYDYGNQSLSIGLDPSAESSPGAEGGAGAREYRGESQGTAGFVEIGDVQCNDIMSGELFEASIIVRFGTRELHGCGRWLQQASGR